MFIDLEEALGEARILRDRGFTEVQTAVELRDAGALEAARITLYEALGFTAPFVSGVETLIGPRLLVNRTPRPLYREVCTEHGATLGLIGRLVTAEQVLLDEDTTGDSDAAIEARNIEQQPYGAAHVFLRVGNNPGDLAINALAAARQEKINRRTGHSAVWLLRASRGLNAAIPPRPTSLSGYVGYDENLSVFDLSTRERALASVYRTP